MQLVLEKRAERSNAIALVSPLIAIGLTIVTMVILFAILGKNPICALWVYFIEPLTDSYSLQEIAVKATPLVMIAIGLVALLSRQCLEYRRRRPIPDRRGCRKLACGDYPGHRCRALGACRRCWCLAPPAARSTR